MLYVSTLKPFSSFCLNQLHPYVISFGGFVTQRLYLLNDLSKRIALFVWHLLQKFAYQIVRFTYICKRHLIAPFHVIKSWIVASEEPSDPPLSFF